MFTKQQILEEIKRTAKENGGKPLGAGRFEKETVIKANDWEKYWARFGDALKEAGFAPNEFQSGYSDEFLANKIIEVIHKLGKFPTLREIKVEKNNNPEFPSTSAFYRWGSSKHQMAEKLMDYCKSKTGYDDIIKLCESVIQKFGTGNVFSGNDTSQSLGEVYLFKHGRYYKIGKTNDTVRRGTELRIQLPEKMDLIHSIKTDDPSGIEAYWHRRFDSKRMNGEWFDLNSTDIKAFKRWKRII
ncbi:MAG: GIY-YIG nuclease family protein [Candidatus Doudnabacteria bacterium]|nr:GIY-YIG nuclease family protein [Candidatus Doudnabacteria bacterium]